jgi:hypothetical protein
MKSTACSRHASASGAKGVHRRDLHPGCALDQGLDDHRRQLPAVVGDHLRRHVEATGVVEARGAQHRKPQRVEELGAEATGAQRE